METIPTAKDYILKNITDFWQGGKAQYTSEDVEEAMINFAKLHVKACKKEISEKNLLTDFAFEFLQDGASEAIDKDLILDCYLNKIK